MTDYTSYLCSDNKARIAALDANGNILALSSVAANAIDGHLVAVPGSALLTPAQVTQMAGTLNWTLTNGTLAAKVIPPTPLATLQANACASIDQAAENARLQFITPGSAQAIVYTAKQAEAAAFLTQYPTSTAAAGATASVWPFLNAEVGITASTLFGVAQAIQTVAQSWISTASQIEQLRLSGKQAVNAATTSAAVTTATQITWPTPS